MQKRLKPGKRWKVALCQWWQVIQSTDFRACMPTLKLQMSQQMGESLRRLEPLMLSMDATSDKAGGMMQPASCPPIVFAS